MLQPFVRASQLLKGGGKGKKVSPNPNPNPNPNLNPNPHPNPNQVDGVSQQICTNNVAQV